MENRMEKMGEETQVIDTKKSTSEKLSRLHKCFADMADDIGAIVAQSLNAANVEQVRRGLDNVVSEVREMKSGPSHYNLDNISSWKSEVGAKMGYAAETIEAAKETLAYKRKGLTERTYRSDALSEYGTNDPYVDLVRKNISDTIDRIQLKFVGESGAECLTRLLKPEFEKYFEDGKVDKIAIPKEHYEELTKGGVLKNRIAELEADFQKLKESGDPKAADCERKLRHCKQLENGMLEDSGLTKAEVREAVTNTEQYVEKIQRMEMLKTSHTAGIESAAFASSITAAVSTVDNIQKVMAGEITAKEAFVDVAKDTGTAGIMGYGTAFVSTTAAQAMTASGHSLIQACGKAGVPGAVISFGINSFDSVTEYAQGDIDGKQLAYELGESAASVAGGMAGAAASTVAGAKIGAAIGTVIPGAGTAVGAVAGAAAGFGVSVVGGMVGTAIASEAYKTAVELGSEGIELLAGKAQEAANSTVEKAMIEMPNKINDIKAAINTFAETNKIPIHV